MTTTPMPKQWNFCVEFWGEYGCYTRPELKVERYSYEVITPSSARACLEAIFWKPRIAWKIDRIEVLSPIKMVTLSKNEVKLKSTPIFIEEERVIRSNTMVRFPHYRIHATMILKKDPFYIKDGKKIVLKDRPPEKENIIKYASIFEGRCLKGKFHHPPYFGTRECVANFRLVKNFEEESKVRPPIDVSKDFGLMFYDFHYQLDGKKLKAQPRFFRAVMNNGVIEVPQFSETIG